MTCPQLGTPQNRIQSLSARYALSGDYSGIISFSDADCTDVVPCTGFCVPVSAGIDATLVNGADELSELVSDCYEFSPNWISGLMRSIEVSNAEFSTAYDVASYYEYLKEKALSTQQFLGAPLSVVIPTVLQFYAGVPNALVDIVSYTDNAIKGPVEGNNLWEELRLLAQAGCADLFVQVGGKLTIEGWKDHNSPVELTIPSGIVISAEKVKLEGPGTTVIRAKGASLSGYAQGEKVLSNNEQGPGVTSKCVTAGVETPVVDVSFNNLTGDADDIRNATILASDFIVQKEKSKTREGAFLAKVRNIDPNALFGPNPKSSTFVALGKTRAKLDEKINNRKSRLSRNNRRTSENIVQSAINYGIPLPFSSFDKGSFGSVDFSQPSADKNTLSDRSELQVIETVLANPDSAACGIAYEDIENKYIFSKLLLFKLAVRRYQEILLAQHTWAVEIAYFPCVKLNQVVEFTVPPKINCPARTVIGIVGGIDVSSDSSSGVVDTKMTITVMDTECLGNIDVVSENLIVPTNVSSGIGTTGWTTSVQNLNNQVGLFDCVFISNTGGLLPVFATYTQTDLTIGDTYDWSFDHAAIIGAPTTIFTATNFAGSTTLTGSGSQSGTFVATHTTVSFRWQITASTSIKTSRICNFQFKARGNV